MGSLKAPKGTFQALAAWLVQERRPFLLFPDDHSSEAEELRRSGSTLAVPVPVGESLLGILALREKGSGDLYTQEDMELLARLAQANIRDIRRMIYDLRPAALDELGLLAALREYVARYQEEQGLKVALVDGFASLTRFRRL